MTQPLHDRVIALAEGRQLEELAALLEQQGATVLRCPMLGILDAPDAAPVHAWIDDLIAGRFALVILMTGEAVRRLTGFAERSGQRDAFIHALGRTRTLTRGPKPGQALKELGLSPSRIARAPTTDGVIASLADESLAGATVGVTLYGADNPTLIDALRRAGATPHTVLSYVYAPAADDDRIIDLLARMERGEVAAIVFTSTPQIDRVWEVAGKRGLEETLRRGLERTKVAAIGPIAADSLRHRGVRVDICPEQGWVMKNLVQKIARDLGAR